MKSKRIVRREQVSRNGWHVEIKLEEPGQVDRELKGWLKKAYELAEQRQLKAKLFVTLTALLTLVHIT